MEMFSNIIKLNEYKHLLCISYNRPDMPRKGTVSYVSPAQKKQMLDKLHAIELYKPISLTRRVTASFAHLMNASGSSPTVLKNELKGMVATMVEGKCTIEGFVKPGSVEITKHSFGVIHGQNIIIDVDFQCMICTPSDNDVIECIAKNITQAGIRAVSPKTFMPSPIEVYIARDLHKKCDFFDSIIEGQTILIKVIASRFVLNDPHVSIIGHLIRVNVPRQIMHIQVIPSEVDDVSTSVKQVMIYQDPASRTGRCSEVEMPTFPAFAIAPSTLANDTDNTAVSFHSITPATETHTPVKQRKAVANRKIGTSRST